MSNKFMLSFHRGKVIAIALDSKGKEKFKIHITPEEEEPDVQVDDVLGLIDDADVESLRSAMKLGNIEIKLLKRAIKRKTNKGLSDKLVK